MEQQQSVAPADTPLAGLPVAQVALVVRDIEAARRTWAGVLGQTVPDIITTAPGADVAQTYNGVPCGARAKLAFLKLGPGVQLELIEPIEDGDGADSTWHAVLREKGEGLHHIAFWVEGMQRHVNFLRERGVPMVQRGDMGEGQYAYCEGGAVLNGVLLELLEKKRDARAE